MNKEFLRNLPLFASLSDEDLDWLLNSAEPVTIPRGEVLMQEGSPGDAFYIALEGRLEITKRTGERDISIAGCGPGDVVGEMSLLEGTPRSATVCALESARLLKISRATFEDLLARSPSAALGIVRTVTARLRSTELMLRQSEKMAGLGTLSAGLAHELNNPAAAVRRSAVQLREAVVDWQRASAQLASLDFTPAQIEMVNRVRMELPGRAASPVRLDSLDRSDMEAELQSWLEDQGLEGSWELAPVLVALRWSVEELASMTDGLPKPQVVAFLRWLVVACTVYALLEELSEGASRISEIVKAVRSYSYLDQGPVQLVDVHEGLENTLVILRYKLKQGVTVHREFATDLPRIEAYASELNQVWTNIIDNAVDAMGGKGEITLRTYGENRHVVVEITDNGPGIPPEARPRIFDAFFTTKPLGAGTGLGLHISYNIIVNQHRGEITVESAPGHTTFRVRLPVQLPIPAGNGAAGMRTT